MTLKEDKIKKSYSEALIKKKSQQQNTCCSSQIVTSCTCSQNDIMETPEPISFGCIYLLPILKEKLRKGMEVLDLGSGPGHDLMIAAELIGPIGRAIGVDFTTTMIEEARRNVQNRGLTNVTLLEANINDIPLPDNSVDVIISNCVINLTLNKKEVFQEAFRLLKPKGLLIDADVIAIKPLPSSISEDLNLWCACIGGALTEHEHREILREVGFENISIEWGARDYESNDSSEMNVTSGIIFAQKT